MIERYVDVQSKAYFSHVKHAHSYCLPVDVDIFDTYKEVEERQGKVARKN